MAFKIPAQRPKRAAKFGNRKTVIDGITFDSAREARRYCDLRLLQRAGKIRDLELQPRFPCIVNGARVCEYRADFAYHDVERGERVIEDAKGFKTPEYRLKKKLVEALYGVVIVEV